MTHSASIRGVFKKSVFVAGLFAFPALVGLQASTAYAGPSQSHSERVSIKGAQAGYHRTAYKERSSAYSYSKAQHKAEKRAYKAKKKAHKKARKYSKNRRNHPVHAGRGHKDPHGAKYDQRRSSARGYYVSAPHHGRHVAHAHGHKQRIYDAYRGAWFYRTVPCNHYR
ncbi:hypothetical protein [Iodidimonas gelatinilytica]|uniref:hypothetical protein n=1 Tax=Iodidimonas gelatinilytica TaxID=1236966 RepID=UPI001230B458|nr:hypothetical protein [Iodidimonas gelatinilytica]